MIEVEGLTKRFSGTTAVHDISFHVERGEIVGFLGPNGAGKSTTLRMITGFLPPSAGRIRVGGIDAVEESLAARRLVGYMPEGVPLYPELRVGEYLRHRAELKGVGRKQIVTRVGASLEMAGVVDVESRIIGQLSKGYRQRVGLADALVADPPLLILDEPTSGLDPNQIRQIRKLIRGFAGDKTVFLSTHILPEVEATCGRVVIIDRGRMVGEGTPDSLRSARRQSVLLDVRAEEGSAVQKLGAALRDLPGVDDSEVVSEEEAAAVARMRLWVEPGDAVMERVFGAVVKSGLVLRQLTREQARLEEVFAQLTDLAPREQGPGDLEAAETDESEEPPGESRDEESPAQEGEGIGHTDGEAEP